jgi:hypothetical protein
MHIEGEAFAHDYVLWCAEDIRRTRVAEKKRVGRVRERAETLLSSMLALLNQLADSARILNSPLSSSLLVIPLNDEDQETNAAWSSAENLVKSLKVSSPPFPPRICMQPFLLYCFC